MSKLSRGQLGENSSCGRNRTYMPVQCTELESNCVTIVYSGVYLGFVVMPANSWRVNDLSHNKMTAKAFSCSLRLPRSKWLQGGLQKK